MFCIVDKGKKWVIYLRENEIEYDRVDVSAEMAAAFDFVEKFRSFLVEVWMYHG